MRVGGTTLTIVWVLQWPTLFVLLTKNQRTELSRLRHKVRKEVSVRTRVDLGGLCRVLGSWLPNRQGELATRRYK